MIIDDQGIKTLSALPANWVTQGTIAEAFPQRSAEWLDKWAAQLVQVVYDYDLKRSTLSDIINTV